MRLCTVRTDTGTSAARVDGDHLVLLEAPDVGAVFRAATMPQDTGVVVASAAAVYVPPVLNPAKIICVGLNYRSHLLELGSIVPSYPTLFSKFSTTLMGAHNDLVLPAVTSAAVWEVELAVVISRAVPRGPMSQHQAQAAIGGYTVANDITMRDYQRHGKQWLPGKAFDASTPIGPVLVTADELGAVDKLRLTCAVDGKTVQDGTTADLVFPPADIIRYIAEFSSLAPGDILLTGTPAGAGPHTTEFLQPGQILTSTIAGIGTCRNLVVRGR